MVPAPPGRFRLIMDSFGEYLSRERELRGVTLEEIAKASNINITYLRALENDDYKNLPQEVFVKGFLRCYADVTGMDYNEVRLAYDSFMAKRKAKRGIPEQPIITPKKYSFKLFSFLAIIVLVFVFSFIVFHSVEKGKEVKSVLVSEEEITQGGEEEGIEKSVEENIDILLQSESTEGENFMQAEDVTARLEEKDIADAETLPSAPEIIKTPEIKVEDFLILSMEAYENAWISIVIDDDKAKEALLLTGETVRWKAKEKFVVTLGNVRQSSLKLNGKDVILPEAPTNVLRNYVISLDNIKDQ